MEPGPGFWPDYILVPSQIAFSSNLQPLDLKVYGIIYWIYSMREGRCTISNDTFTEFIGVLNAHSIQASLLRLENEGFIKRVFLDKKRKIRSEIIPLLTFRNLNKEVPSKEGTVPSNKDEEVPSNEGQNKSNINKENIIQLHELYKQKINPEARLTEKSSLFIKKCLKNFTIDDLKLAIKKFSRNDWRMKHNGDKPIWWFFRSDNQIETWLALNDKVGEVKDEDLI